MKSLLIILLIATSYMLSGQSKIIVGVPTDSTFLELKGLENKKVLLWDTGNTELRNSYNLLLTKRNWMRIYIDSDANESGAEFSIFNNSNGVLGSTTLPKVRFGLDDGDSWINTGSLGIGTTLPNRKLDVVGDIGFTGDLYQNGLLYKQVMSINDLTDAASIGGALFLGAGAGGSNLTPSIAIGHNALSVNTGSFNLAIGGLALESNTTGIRNIAIGESALKENTIGDFNIALGYKSMWFFGGTDNTAIGDKALRGGSISSNTNSGTDNIAIGKQAMEVTKTGSHNIALGNNSLHENISGSNNVAIGKNALSTMSTGSGNIAIGSEAGKNETGSNKLYIDNSDTATPLIYGDFATNAVKFNGTLQATGNVGLGTAPNTIRMVVNSQTGQIPLQINVNNSTKLHIDPSGNVGVGTITPSKKLDVVGDINFTSSLYKNGVLYKPDNISINDLTNGKTTATSLFLGTGAGSVNTGNDNLGIATDALLLNTTGTGNTAIGFKTLLNNTTGDYNTALGGFALVDNTTGYENTALGSNSLYKNTTGYNNTAAGRYALHNNTTGRENTAVGRLSLFYNTTGYKNTAVGIDGLRSNTTGYYNTATGVDALRANTSGYQNTAFGNQALYSNTTGINNTGNGYRGLELNTTGYDNTGFGALSLNENSIGNENTAMGKSALLKNTDGNNNTAIGAYAFNIADHYTNSGAFGYDAQPNASARIRIGNTNVTQIGGYTNWTNVSDRRFKVDIQENIPGLDFIKKLRPVSYHLDMEALAVFNKTPDSLRLYDLDVLKAAEVQTGFIAQEVEAAAQSIGFDFHGIDKPVNAQTHYGLRYAEFTVPLVKAVQELSAENELIKQENTKLSNQYEALKLVLDQQVAAIELLRVQVASLNTNTQITQQD